MVLRVFVVCVFVLSMVSVSWASGAHDGLLCTGCHGIHTAKGDIIFAVEPNKKAVNPKTKQSYTGTTALCLGCHETPDKGGMGIMAVSANMSHPYGVEPNPKVATVPSALLRGGKLECVGCHDPHPSNPNYKYLRVDTAKGSKMSDFCAMCHSSKADAAVVRNLKIFNSMDERSASATTVSSPETRTPMSVPAAPKKKQ
ncbi:MAG: cytochrome C [Nitrospirae bacterium]|nr:cytochrome C [Nitrospirota bacterium]